MRKHRLPGDLTNTQSLQELIRVNHAGEYGAKRIYEGQMQFTRNPEIKQLLQHMLEQELSHLKYFEQEIVKRQVRPTFMLPFWHITGYVLGAVTGLMGTKTTMLCTEAIEEVIDEHYQNQINHLPDSEEALKIAITKFRNEELEHSALASEKSGKPSLLTTSLKFFISMSCKLAIKLAKKI